MFKIAFGVAVGVVEDYGVGAAYGACDGNDHQLLRGSVDYTIVNEDACGVVERNAHIAEILVEVDVNSLFCRTCFDVIGTSIDIQLALQSDLFSSAWNVVVFHVHIDKDLLWVGGLCFPSAETQGAKACENENFFLHGV